MHKPGLTGLPTFNFFLSFQEIGLFDLWSSNVLNTNGVQFLIFASWYQNKEE